MSKRYYVCDVLGDGTEDNAWRTAVSEHGVNHSATFEERAGGRALVVVNAVDHTPLLDDPRIDPLPEFPLDAKLNAMRQDTLNRMNGRLMARGFATGWANSDGFREVVRGIGLQINPNFHENNFDVSS